jgi:hypothetical protein
MQQDPALEQRESGLSIYKAYQLSYVAGPYCCLPLLQSRFAFQLPQKLTPLLIPFSSSTYSWLAHTISFTS